MNGTRRWIGLGALAVAGALAVGALTIDGRSSDQVDLSAAPTSAPVVPSTIAPLGSPSLAAAATARPASPPADTTTVPPTITTTPRSPLAALVGEPVSVVPAPRVRPPAPARIHIPALGIEVPVRAVGLEPDGQLEIPDEREVGWYGLGSSPGEPGASVLAGHVSWNRTTGPFFRLSELATGSTIDIGLADGTTRTYEVVERAQYPKQGLPVERIWATGGPEVLVLITCGGAFNPDIRRFADNVVVYAVPVA